MGGIGFAPHMANSMHSYADSPCIRNALIRASSGSTISPMHS